MFSTPVEFCWALATPTPNYLLSSLVALLNKNVRNEILGLEEKTLKHKYKKQNISHILNSLHLISLWQGVPKNALRQIKEKYYSLWSGTLYCKKKSTDKLLKFNLRLLSQFYCLDCIIKTVNLKLVGINQHLLLTCSFRKHRPKKRYRRTICTIFLDFSIKNCIYTIKLLQSWIPPFPLPSLSSFSPSHQSIL